MFNHCFISGRVCSEPELDCSQRDFAYCTFRLAFQAKGRSAGRIDVYCLRDVALFAGRYLHQGDRVALLGSLFVSDVRGEQGEWGRKAEMLAMAMELVKDDDRIQMRDLPQ
jgi:single-stranded DNA-binding protein